MLSEREYNGKRLTHTIMCALPKQISVNKYKNTVPTLYNTATYIAIAPTKLFENFSI